MLLEIVIPEKQVLRTEVDYVSIPGEEGEFGVYPAHIPLVAGLKSGVLSYDSAADKNGGGKKYVAVHGGYAEVRPDGVMIIADCCELGEDIDQSRAASAEKRTREALKQQEKLEEVAVARLEAKLWRSLTRQQTMRNT